MKMIYAQCPKTPLASSKKLAGGVENHRQKPMPKVRKFNPPAHAPDGRKDRYQCRRRGSVRHILQDGCRSASQVQLTGQVSDPAYFPRQCRRWQRSSTSRYPYLRRRKQDRLSRNPTQILIRAMYLPRRYDRVKCDLSF